MKHKIISLLGAVALTATTFSAVAQTPPIKSITLEQAVSFCKIAHAAYKAGDKGKTLDLGMSMLDKDTQNRVAGICLAYGVGYDEGKKWTGNAS